MCVVVTIWARATEHCRSNKISSFYNERFVCYGKKTFVVAEESPCIIECYTSLENLRGLNCEPLYLD